MSEFETQVLSMFEKIDKRFDSIDKRLDKLENDIEEIKEDAKVTRAAVNYIGQRLDDLIQELKANQVIA